MSDDYKVFRHGVLNCAINEADAFTQGIVYAFERGMDYQRFQDLVNKKEAENASSPPTQKSVHGSG